MRIRVTRGDVPIRWPHRVDGTNAEPAPGRRAGEVFSFPIDIERDPRSDDFHGRWDDMGGGTFLNISGNGSGRVADGEN